MAESQGPNRADRRRFTRRTGIDLPPPEPPFELPKTFDKCPNPECGSTRRFVREALKHDVNLEDLEGQIPILFSFEYDYDTPVGPVKLIAYGDACYDCGTPYIVEMVKFEGPRPPKLHLPPGTGRRN